MCKISDKFEKIRIKLKNQCSTYSMKLLYQIAYGPVFNLKRKLDFLERYSMYEIVRITFFASRQK